MGVGITPLNAALSQPLAPPPSPPPPSQRVCYTFQHSKDRCPFIHYFKTHNEEHPLPHPTTTTPFQKLEAMVTKICKPLVSYSSKRPKLLLMFLCYVNSLNAILTRYTPNLPSANLQPQIIGANLLNEVHLGHIAGPLPLKTFRSVPKRNSEQWHFVFFFTYHILRGPLKA